MPKFNMNDAGGGNTTACRLDWIDINCIDENELNEEVYNLSEIEELADDIMINGLLQAPLVQNMHNGRYTLIAGHRRLTAVKELVQRGEIQFKKIQCLIDNDDDDVSVGLKLLSANTTIRKKTNGELLAEAQKSIELMKKKKNKEKLPGKVRDMVAKKLYISSASLGDLISVGNNLQEPLLTWFKQDRLSKSVAVEMSKCQILTQNKITAAMYKGEEFTVKDVKRYRDIWEGDEDDTQETEARHEERDNQTDTAIAKEGALSNVSEGEAAGEAGEERSENTETDCYNDERRETPRDDKDKKSESGGNTVSDPDDSHISESSEEVHKRLDDKAVTERSNVAVAGTAPNRTDMLIALTNLQSVCGSWQRSYGGCYGCPAYDGTADRCEINMEKYTRVIRSMKY